MNSPALALAGGDDVELAGVSHRRRHAVAGGAPHGGDGGAAVARHAVVRRRDRRGELQCGERDSTHSLDIYQGSLNTRMGSCTKRNLLQAATHPGIPLSVTAHELKMMYSSLGLSATKSTYGSQLVLAVKTTYLIPTEDNHS